MTKIFFILLSFFKQFRVKAYEYVNIQWPLENEYATFHFSYKDFLLYVDCYHFYKRKTRNQTKIKKMNAPKCIDRVVIHS